MKNFYRILLLIVGCSLAACWSKTEEKGFRVTPESGTKEEENTADGISKDSLAFETRPSNVLLTGIPRYRLTTIYKVNYKVNYRGDSSTFIGENNHHGNYNSIGETLGNQWHYNLMPGFESVYGYNMVNISHYDVDSKTGKVFFERPVLVKTLYHPSFSRDTLNYKPITRNFFMVSVYDEDTNKDGFVNVRDLRRLYFFDINVENKRALVPVNYTVLKSEYDPANDFMFVFAKLDENENGTGDDREPIHIFWIDLKNPANTGRQY